MPFEKPAGNLNCEATKMGCAQCLRIGMYIARATVEEDSPRIDPVRRNLEIDDNQASINARIQDALTRNAFKICFDMQDFANQTGYDTGKSVAKKLNGA